MAQFRWDRRVEFCETDAAGIAHFSSLFQYMEQAEHALLRSLGESVFSHEPNSITWPRVHVEADFLGPAQFEDLISVHVRVLKLGSTSIRYGFDLQGPRGAVAKGETISVCCRRIRDSQGISSLEKVEIPAHLRQALAPYLA